MQYARDVPLTLTNDVTLTTNNVKQSPDICAVFSYTPTCTPLYGWSQTLVILYLDSGAQILGLVLQKFSAR